MKRVAAIAAAVAALTTASIEAQKNWVY